MKKIMIVLTVLLSAQFLRAQEKYHYLLISYNTYERFINISDGNTYKYEKLAKSEGDFDANLLLRKIEEFEDKGWELTNREMVVGVPGINSKILYLNAYMRKKR